MARLTKRTVEAAKPGAEDYILWDDDLRGFGLRVFTTGKRSYLIQYRAEGRTRRFTIGPHGAWAPEAARREAKALVGRIAQGDNPAEKRRLDREAISIKELCRLYMEDAAVGLVPGKRGRPKKVSTLAVDRSRIDAHIVPLLGTRLVKDLTRADVYRFMKDVALGKARRDVRTKTRGRSIVRGGLGAASRTVGLLGGILTYAVANGVIEHNPVHGVRRPAMNVRTRRLDEGEYRILGDLLADAERAGGNEAPIAMLRLLALTGCRRGEIEHLRWEEVDEVRQCFRLTDTKEGRSIRPIGRQAFDLLKARRPQVAKGYVFPGAVEGKPFIGLPKFLERMLQGEALEGITSHVLRHSFASMANDLGYTEATIAAMLGHSLGTTTSRYVHHLDRVLVSAADAVAEHIAQLMGPGVRGPAIPTKLLRDFEAATRSWPLAAE